jgi:hypothetical protein
VRYPSNSVARAAILCDGCLNSMNNGKVLIVTISFIGRLLDRSSRLSVILSIDHLVRRSSSIILCACMLRSNISAFFFFVGTTPTCPVYTVAADQASLPKGVQTSSTPLTILLRLAFPTVLHSFVATRYLRSGSNSLFSQYLDIISHMS